MEHERGALSFWLVYARFCPLANGSRDLIARKLTEAWSLSGLTDQRNQNVPKFASLADAYNEPPRNEFAPNFCQPSWPSEPMVL